VQDRGPDGAVRHVADRVDERLADGRVPLRTSEEVGGLWRRRIQQEGVERSPRHAARVVDLPPIADPADRLDPRPAVHRRVGSGEQPLRDLREPLPVAPLVLVRVAAR